MSSKSYGLWPRLPKALRKNRSCRDKIKHPSWVGANTHRQNLIDSYPDRSYDVYSCHWCDHYHVGRSMGGTINPFVGYEVLQDELGDRAYFQLHQESFGSSRSRRNAIEKRAKAALKRWYRDYAAKVLVG